MNRPKWLRHLFLRLAGYNPASILDVSTKEGLAVAGAMRGPDDDELLAPFKWLLTAWIRRWKGVPSVQCAVRRIPMTTHRISEVESRIRELAKHPQLRRPAHHYFEHAFHALKYLTVPKEHQEELDKLLAFTWEMTNLTHQMMGHHLMQYYNVVETAIERLKALEPCLEDGNNAD